MRDGVKMTFDTTKFMQQHGLNIGGRTQQYIDSEVLRLSKPYVPFKTGTLADSGNNATQIGSGKVEWNAPYARFQYYGKVMVGEKSGSAWARLGEKKVVTDKDLTYHGGGLCGPFWVERMKADHLDEILQGAAKEAGGVGRK